MAGEIPLQNAIIKMTRCQPYRVVKTAERFVSGRPDMRFSGASLGQLDVELKVWSKEVVPTDPAPTGITPLQERTIRAMNQNGQPTVGLVAKLLGKVGRSKHWQFWFALEEVGALHRQPDLDWTESSPFPVAELFRASLVYLEDRGYDHHGRIC